MKRKKRDGDKDVSPKREEKFELWMLDPKDTPKNNDRDRVRPKHKIRT